MKFIGRLITFVEDLLTGIVSLLSKESFNTKRYRFNIPEVWYSPWNEHIEFNSLYAVIRHGTLISRRKLFDLYQIGLQINRDANGAILEIGTYRGGSGALLALVFAEKPLIFWDIWSKDVEEDNTFVKKIYSVVGDLDQAKHLLKKIGTHSATNASFVDDIFPNSSIISGWAGEISMVHFDIYDSNAFTRGIEMLWPLLSVGGIFVVGGYGAISLNPLTDAVNLFVNGSNCLFIESQSGMGLIIKR